MFKRFCATEPIFVVIDVRPGEVAIQTTAYMAVEEVESDDNEIERVFRHIPCSIRADEAEEVSVFAVLLLCYQLFNVVIIVQ